MLLFLDACFFKSNFMNVVTCLRVTIGGCFPSLSVGSVHFSLAFTFIAVAGPRKKANTTKQSSMQKAKFVRIEQDQL